MHTPAPTHTLSDALRPAFSSAPLFCCGARGSLLVSHVLLLLLFLVARQRFQLPLLQGPSPHRQVWLHFSKSKAHLQSRILSHQGPHTLGSAAGVCRGRAPPRREMLTRLSLPAPGHVPSGLCLLSVLHPWGFPAASPDRFLPGSLPSLSLLRVPGDAAHRPSPPDSAVSRHLGSSPASAPGGLLGSQTSSSFPGLCGFITLLSGAHSVCRKSCRSLGGITPAFSRPSPAPDTGSCSEQPRLCWARVGSPSLHSSDAAGLNSTSRKLPPWLEVELTFPSFLCDCSFPLVPFQLICLYFQHHHHQTQSHGWAQCKCSLRGLRNQGFRHTLGPGVRLSASFPREHLFVCLCPPPVHTPPLSLWRTLPQTRAESLELTA